MRLAQAQSIIKYNDILAILNPEEIIASSIF